MLNIENKKDCCGCWACYNTCPKACIDMAEDNEGFRYPSINKAVCIDCGMCEKVCPVLHATPTDTPHPQDGWLLQHNNDTIRHESTSGGAFTALAAWAIRQGGVAFGAAYRKGTFTVVHQAVEREEDLHIFRNSKYVQSQMGNAYQQAKAYLKEGRLVVFSGTPCQIEGLLHYLRGREYEGLVCVDLVCRGIPSPRILEKHIEVQSVTCGGG